MEYSGLMFASVVAPNELPFQWAQMEPSSFAAEFVYLYSAQTKNAATNNTKLLSAPLNRNENLHDKKDFTIQLLQ